MADLIDCPNCGVDVSRQALSCLSCGEALNNIPDAITPELIAALGDDELGDLLHSYVAEVLAEHGCDMLEGPTDSEVLESMPRCLRAVYTLSTLDFEVTNGGFYQWLTNSSGMLTQETLDDLVLIGATVHVELLNHVIQLNRELESKHACFRRRWESPEPTFDRSEVDACWTDIEENYESHFDSLSHDYYQLQDDDSFWPRLVRFVREHSTECVHTRGELKEG